MPAPGTTSPRLGLPADGRVGGFFDRLRKGRRPITTVFHWLPNATQEAIESNHRARNRHLRVGSGPRHRAPEHVLPLDLAACLVFAPGISLNWMTNGKQRQNR